MQADRRFVVVMVALGFIRSAVIVGTVVAFLAMAGAFGAHG